VKIRNETDSQECGRELLARFSATKRRQILEDQGDKLSSLAYVCIELAPRLPYPNGRNLIRVCLGTAFCLGWESHERQAQKARALSLLFASVED
jgi:hypothetical protein